ncbi:hypothetical protein CANINC_004824 [Pichia inconspicua]|uniref:enoyl-[acyl-carrier-protein] reductase n=1 Tax=Pichia inconspicua TaxID=52247 RepID=A0A4V6TTP2_9ASCO|nr:hypothetical protein CANINC_004824 [[Candida] inconspicua]
MFVRPSLTSIIRNTTQPIRAMSTIKAHSIVYNNYGEPLEQLKAHSYDINLDSLKPDDILVQTVACPINPSDINQIQGVYPSRPEISIDALPNLESPAAPTGNEGLFKVVATGSNVTGFEKGDWCIPAGVNFGTWTTHKVTKDKNLLKMPKTISKTQAATIAVNPSSAYQMLTQFVKLQPGDWFIQNGANSQVGRAAIQIGKKLGFKSLNIVRNRDNLDELVKELESLGATKVITEDDNESKDYGKVIKQLLNGQEIKLGLNCVGGPSATGLARKLGNDATMLTYGAMSMKPVSLPTGLFIFKNLTAKGFWITGNIKRHPETRLETINAVIKLMEDGDLVDAKYNETQINPNEVSNEEFLQSFLNAIQNSKKGKQLVVFE